MFNYCIWDFNGTILDDTDLCVRIENTLRTKRELPETTRLRYQAEYCFPVEDYYKKAGADFKNESFADVAREFMEIYQPASLGISLRAGMISLITALKRQSRKQILLSASQRSNLIEQTNHYGITDLFDDILGLDDIYGGTKVDTALRWFVKNRVTPEYAVVIGDTTHDYEVSQAARCGCLLLCGGHNSRERLLATGAAVMDSVEELAELLM